MANFEELLVEGRPQSTKWSFEGFIAWSASSHDDGEHVEGQVVVIQASSMKEVEVLKEVTAQGYHIVLGIRANLVALDAVFDSVKPSDRNRADNVHEAEPIDTEVVIR